MTARIARINRVKALFLLCVLLSVPWALDDPLAGLDGSWRFVINHAAQKGWQFGRDIVFTFGPYGFLYTKVNHPQTYGLTLGFWFFHAITIAGSVAVFMRDQRVTTCCMMLLVLLLGMRAPDAALFLVPLLLLISYATSARLLVGPLLALTAVIALVKFTFAVLGFGMILLIELHRMLRGRRIPYYLLSYVALAFLFFVSAGQDPANFTSYISTSLSIAHGYGDAMQVGGPVGEVVLFAGLAACFIGLVLHIERRQRRLPCMPSRGYGVLLTLGTCLFAYVAMKAGFVRHDRNHSLIAWSSLSAGAAIYAILVLPNVEKTRVRAALLGLCTIAAAATLLRTAQVERPLSLGQSFARGVLERVVAISGLLLGEYASDQAARDAVALTAIRTNHPLPDLKGTVDIYPWNQSALIAHGLEYQPRPVFQSYSVYSSSLIELNTRHLRGDESATFLLFDIKTIDARMPSMDEGQLWPHIIARYEPQGMADPYLLLRKRDKPRRVQLAPIAETSTTWSAPVQVPSDVIPVWVSVEVRKTFLGSLFGMLYKLPPVILDVRLQDGTAHAFRIVPAMAREGFVLSPLVDTPARFAQLFDPSASSQMPPRVSQIALVGYSGVRWLYQEQIDVRFAHLCIEPCSLNQAAPDQTDQVSESS